MTACETTSPVAQDGKESGDILKQMDTSLSWSA
jgi:hypothetical protein